MNILLTNDDGLESPGILLLASALREKGHRVAVLAPDRDRSGVSHSISFLGEPLVVKRRGEDTWSCSGLPVDCVVTAMLGGIPYKPDLILSGINRGSNLGTDLLYSGTAAAARQGSLFGIPSIALSLADDRNGDASHGDDSDGDASHGDASDVTTFYWDMAVAFSLSHLDELAARWKTGTFINVNIPNNPRGPAGLAPAFPSQRLYHDSLTMMEAPGGDRYCFYSAGEVGVVPQAGSDRDVVFHNMAAVSSIWVHPVSGDPRDPAARIWD
ncbi:MAG: 5'/3'-nucleotidase SurE [Treponema sp.]|jgi:5'-nucleotidase|nr:5'/3'-nucleotidase SurE [Treponema sp.]